MGGKRRKILFLTAKLLIAAAMLAWVLSKTHWHDYVETRDGKATFAVLEICDGERDEGRSIRVADGFLWWRSEQVRPAADFKSIGAGGEVVRPGFARSIGNINKLLLLCAACGFLASNLIIACRWWFLLRIQRIRISLWEAVRLTFLGLFFNFVVPGTVGGDLVKAYYVARHTKRKAAVLVSVFMDRILGLTELVLLAAVMICAILVIGIEPFAKLRTAVISVAAVIAIVICTLAFLFSPGLRRAMHLQKLYRRLPIAHHVAAAGKAAELYRKRARALLEAVAMTFGAHVVWVGAIALLGASLNLDTPWYSYFVYIPLIYIIGAVPITPGGVGLLEKLYLVYFSAVNPNMVLALALLGRFIPIFWSLPGILVAVTGPKLPKAETIEAELGLDHLKQGVGRREKGEKLKAKS